MQESISSFLTQDHRHCDEIFATMEKSVASENWSDANRDFNAFVLDLNHHFDMEEKIMFPVFEEKTGMHNAGPTAMMRMEHEQMRSVISQMEADINAKNKNHFFGLSESLMMLMQQHNMKEEQMLYMMADSHLGADVVSVVEQMKALER